MWQNIEEINKIIHFLNVGM